MARLESFVVYLFQPSPLWEKWELQHLKLYAAAAPAKGGSYHHSPASDELSFKLRPATGTPSPTSKTFMANGTSANATRSNSYTATSTNTTNFNITNQDYERERLLKRPSRMALAACVESKDVQENALQCLTLIERLRGLLHVSQP